MLQIISGKFFSNDERFVFDSKAVIYSNAFIRKKIKTNVGIVEPVEPIDEVASYVINYTNQIEKGDGLLIRTGDSEILEHFKLILSFGFNSYFSEFREQVIATSKQIKSAKSNYYPASSFLPEYVQKGKEITSEQIESCVFLIERIIGLERGKYKQIISVLKSIYDSVEVLEYNIDLAYSMLVFSLESLSQKFENYTPCWDDWQDPVKGKLDNVLLELEEEKAIQIRELLIEGKQFKLGQRFIEFIVSNLSNEFFVAGVEYQKNLRKSDLNRVLKNTYDIRSSFAHGLKSILDQLRLPYVAKNYSFNFGGEPYLTYKGLFELTLDVLKNVILKQPQLSQENFNWRNDLPGLMQFELSSEYWIASTKGFNGKGANKKLVAFFNQLELGGNITLLDELMDVIENLLPNVKKCYKKPMVLLYWLYNAVLPPEKRKKEWENIIQKHAEYILPLNFESFTISVYLGVNQDYNLENIIEEYKKYNNDRFKKNSIKLPIITEAMALCKIAHLALRLGENELYTEFIDKAIGELGREVEIQEYVIEMRNKRIEFEEYELVNWKRKKLIDAKKGND